MRDNMIHEASTTTRILSIQAKNVYGSTLFYPDCAEGKLVAQLIGKKTFSMEDMRILERLGYKCQIWVPEYVRQGCSRDLRDYEADKKYGWA
jgi:hypothetical protein